MIVWQFTTVFPFDRSLILPNAGFTTANSRSGIWVVNFQNSQAKSGFLILASDEKTSTGLCRDKHHCSRLWFHTTEERKLKDEDFFYRITQKSVLKIK